IRMQAKRDRPYGANVGSDVLAGGAVAPCRSLHQYPVLVAQADRQAVEFQLGRIFDFLLRIQRFAATAVESDDFVVGETIVNGEHGQGVLHLLELRQRRATDTLRGRVGRQQLGMGLLQLLQLAKQLVVFRVRNGGIIEYVVRVIVPV